MGQDVQKQHGSIDPCNHNFLVTKTEDIAPTIAKAYFIAKSGRPGPVVVDIPKDVTEPNKKSSVPIS